MSAKKLTGTAADSAALVAAREAVARLQDEREALAAAPCSREETIDSIERFVRSVHDELVRFAARFADRRDVPDVLPVALPTIRGDASTGLDTLDAGDGRVVLVAALGEAVAIERLTALADEATGGEYGPTLAERRTRTEEIEREIAAAEWAEERSVRRLLAAGTRIDRRSDIENVLALAVADDFDPAAAAPTERAA